MDKSSTSQERARQAARARREQHERRRRFTKIGVVAAMLLVVGVAAAALLGQGDANKPEPAAWVGSAYTGGPRLAVDQEVIDHGEVPYGHEVEAVYRLKNIGDQVLRIENPEVNILDGC